MCKVHQCDYYFNKLSRFRASNKVAFLLKRPIPKSQIQVALAFGFRFNFFGAEKILFVKSAGKAISSENTLFPPLGPIRQGAYLRRLM